MAARFTNYVSIKNARGYSTGNYGSCSGTSGDSLGSGVRCVLGGHARLPPVDRQGAAVVELAIVLPIVFMLLFGTIEICQRLYLKQSVTIAAYEAARVAARQTSDTETVLSAAELLLEQQGIVGGIVRVRDMTRGSNHIDDVETGDEIRVRIRAAWANNVISRFVVADQGGFRVDAVMLRE